MLGARAGIFPDTQIHTYARNADRIILEAIVSSLVGDRHAGIFLSTCMTRVHSWIRQDHLRRGSFFQPTVGCVDVEARCLPSSFSSSQMNVCVVGIESGAG